MFSINASGILCAILFSFSILCLTFSVGAEDAFLESTCFGRRSNTYVLEAGTNCAGYFICNIEGTGNNIRQFCNVTGTALEVAPSLTFGECVDASEHDCGISEAASVCSGFPPGSLVGDPSSDCKSYYSCASAPNAVTEGPWDACLSQSEDQMRESWQTLPDGSGRCSQSATFQCGAVRQLVLQGGFETMYISETRFAASDDGNTTTNTSLPSNSTSNGGTLAEASTAEDYTSDLGLFTGPSYLYPNLTGSFPSSTTQDELLSPLWFGINSVFLRPHDFFDIPLNTSSNTSSANLTLDSNTSTPSSNASVVLEYNARGEVHLALERAVYNVSGHQSGSNISAWGVPTHLTVNRTGQEENITVVELTAQVSQDLPWMVYGRVYLFTCLASAIQPELELHENETVSVQPRLGVFLDGRRMLSRHPPRFGFERLESDFIFPHGRSSGSLDVGSEATLSLRSLRPRGAQALRPNRTTVLVDAVSITGPYLECPEDLTGCTTWHQNASEPVLACSDFSGPNVRYGAWGLISQLCVCVDGPVCLNVFKESPPPPVPPPPPPPPRNDTVVNTTTTSTVVSSGTVVGSVVGATAAASLGASMAASSSSSAAAMPGAGLLALAARAQFFALTAGLAAPLTSTYRDAADDLSWVNMQVDRVPWDKGSSISGGGNKEEGVSSTSEEEGVSSSSLVQELNEEGALSSAADSGGWEAFGGTCFWAFLLFLAGGSAHTGLNWGLVTFKTWRAKRSKARHGGGGVDEEMEGGETQRQKKRDESSMSWSLLRSQWLDVVAGSPLLPPPLVMPRLELMAALLCVPGLATSAAKLMRTQDAGGAVVGILVLILFPLPILFLLARLLRVTASETSNVSSSTSPVVFQNVSQFTAKNAELRRSHSTFLRRTASKIDSAAVVGTLDTGVKTFSGSASGSSPETPFGRGTEDVEAGREGAPALDSGGSEKKRSFSRALTSKATEVKVKFGWLGTVGEWVNADASRRFMEGFGVIFEDFAGPNAVRERWAVSGWVEEQLLQTIGFSFPEKRGAPQAHHFRLFYPWLLVLRSAVLGFLLGIYDPDTEAPSQVILILVFLIFQAVHLVVWSPFTARLPQLLEVGSVGCECTTTFLALVLILSPSVADSQACEITMLVIMYLAIAIQVIGQWKDIYEQLCERSDVAKNTFNVTRAAFTKVFRSPIKVVPSASPAVEPTPQVEEPPPPPPPPPPAPPPAKLPRTRSQLEQLKKLFGQMGSEKFKNQLRELKTYAQPPPVVLTVLAAYILALHLREGKTTLSSMLKNKPVIPQGKEQQKELWRFLLKDMGAPKALLERTNKCMEDVKIAAPSWLKAKAKFSPAAILQKVDEPQVEKASWAIHLAYQWTIILSAEAAEMEGEVNPFL